MVVTTEQGADRDCLYSNYSRCRSLWVDDDSGDGLDVPKRNSRTPTCKCVRVRSCLFTGDGDKPADYRGSCGPEPRARYDEVESIESRRWATASRSASR